MADIMRRFAESAIRGRSPMPWVDVHYRRPPGEKYWHITLGDRRITLCGLFYREWDEADMEAIKGMRGIDCCLRCWMNLPEGRE
jgi:hypothetical protein